MIRNGVLGRLRPPRDAAQAEADVLRCASAWWAWRMPYAGLLSCEVGVDAGLREGGWSFAITSDWADVESYQAYDEEPEHNRHRRVVFCPLCPDIARVQFEVDR